MPEATGLETGSVPAHPGLTTPPRFGPRLYAFDTSSVVHLRSSLCHLSDPVLPGPFPFVLTTVAFDHSRRRRFETCSCQLVPRGLSLLPHQLFSCARAEFITPARARGTLSSAYRTANTRPAIRSRTTSSNQQSNTSCRYILLRIGEITPPWGVPASG